MKPLASFVIPVKDGAAYLAEAVDSCLRQTRKRIEVVLVDDGSTDSTSTIIDHFKAKDGRVRSARFDECRGRSLARNAGIDMALSDVILTLDADDIAKETRAADTLNFFKKNPTVDIVYGQFQIIDELGRVEGYCDAAPFDWEKLKETKLAFIGHSTMAFRKSVFEKVQYTDGPYSANGIDDWRFQVDAYKAGFKFGAVKRFLSQYRWIPKPRDEKKILELKNICLA